MGLQVVVRYWGKAWRIDFITKEDKGMKTILDIGSTHVNDKGKIKKVIDVIAQKRNHALKFQLFPDKPEYTKSGNIVLKKHMFEWAYQYGKDVGVEVSASVFGKEESDFLKQFNPPWVKFGYSMKHDPLIEEWEGTETIVTSDLMTILDVPRFHDVKHMWTYTIHGQTVYPVHAHIRLLGITKESGGLYEGFSNHGMIPHLESFVWLKYYEYHIRPDNKKDTCPDAIFAVCIDEI